MAHPQLHRQGDRRVFLAAGTAAALLLAPAAHALPLGDALNCSPEALVDDAALREQCEDSGLLPAAVGTAPETGRDAVGSAGDPIEEVVGEVLDRTPTAVGDAVQEAPALVDDVVESVPVPAPVDPAIVPDVVPGPAEDGIGAADASVTPVRPAPAPQGPGIALPPFVRRGIPASTSSRTTAPLRHQPIAAPVMSAPFFGDFAQLAEDFVSSRSSGGTGLEAFTGGGTSTIPGPDASSWLLATASGMLLLVGASHVARARNRYTASVAH